MDEDSHFDASLPVRPTMLILLMTLATSKTDMVLPQLLTLFSYLWFDDHGNLPRPESLYGCDDDDNLDLRPQSAYVMSEGTEKEIRDINSDVDSDLSDDDDASDNRSNRLNDLHVKEWNREFQVPILLSSVQSSDISIS